MNKEDLVKVADSCVDKILYELGDNFDVDYLRSCIIIAIENSVKDEL